jgi:hypothetical protein
MTKYIVEVKKLGATNWDKTSEFNDMIELYRSLKDGLVSPSVFSTRNNKIRIRKVTSQILSEVLI